MRFKKEIVKNIVIEVPFVVENLKRSIFIIEDYQYVLNMAIDSVIHVTSSLYFTLIQNIFINSVTEVVATVDLVVVEPEYFLSTYDQGSINSIDSDTLADLGVSLEHYLLIYDDDTIGSIDLVILGDLD